MKARMLNILAVALLLAPSCRYKDLCYTHPHTADLRVEVDWSKSRYARYDDGSLPTGMTLIAYSRDGGAPVSTSSNNIYTASLRLEEGIYDILLFNQSFIEFGSINFTETGSYGNVGAFSVESKAAWYMKADPQGNISKTPEWLAAARLEGLEVTEDMTKSRSRSATRGVSTAYVTDEGTHVLTPRSAIEKARVMVHVNGYHNLASIRAVVKNFALGYYMGRDVNAMETTAYEMRNWKAERDKEDYTKGNVSADFQLFGLPDGFSGRGEDIVVHIECLLVDGKTIKTFEFNVGDKVRELNTDVDVDVDIDINIDIEITLPDVEPAESSSGGFGVSVDDWDEDIITEIPME